MVASFKGTLDSPTVPSCSLRLPVKPHIFTFMRLCYFDIATLVDPKECLINGGAGIAGLGV